MSFGPLGRGGARRRTRRRMRRRSATAMSMEQQQMQKQANNNPNQMSSEVNAAPGDSDIDQLEKLADLKEKGIITDAEFEAKKTQILHM